MRAKSGETVTFLIELFGNGFFSLFLHQISK